MPDNTLEATFLAVVTENVELRLQLAEVQDQCVELAIDAGELHVQVERLQARIVELEHERDAWQAEAGRLMPQPGRA